MEIKQYYFALYSKALLEENEPIKNENIFPDNIKFYEKRFYCAHIKKTTYETCDPEELSFLAKDDESDENDYENDDITLDEGEWIENLNKSKVVCTHPETGEEVDGILYLEENKLYYYLAETGITKFASWCNKEDMQ
jgi:hypothetical protein